MTIIDARQIRPLERFSALEVLAVNGYDPTTPKVRRTAQYLELWREKSLEWQAKGAAKKDESSPKGGV